MLTGLREFLEITFAVDFEKREVVKRKGDEREMSFFKSILPDVKKISPRYFTMFQRHVIVVLTDGVYGEPSDSFPASSNIKLPWDLNTDNN